MKPLYQLFRFVDSFTFINASQNIFVEQEQVMVDWKGEITSPEIVLLYILVVDNDRRLKIAPEDQKC